MSAADRAAWASARTLADLGELTACWLEGTVLSQPGYAPGCGPDEETVPLIPVLARLNRAGFVTTGSQPAEAGPGYDGAHWEQCAAVEGFTVSERLPGRIGRYAGAYGLRVISREPSGLPRWRYRYDQAVTVTRRNGQHYTYFGVQVPRRHIKDPHLGYGICHRDAVKALCSAWQVTVIDPQQGRDGLLWRLLDSAVSPEGAAR
jgi:hypothetical protein